jgi:hypothetical protein
VVAKVAAPIVEFDAEAERRKKEREEELARLRAQMATWSPYPPNPFIKEINQKGFLTVGFTSDIIVKPDLTIINNGTLYLSDLEDISYMPPPINPATLKRQLNRELPRKNEEKVPVLKVEVLPGSEETNSTALSFTWTVTQ